MNRSPLAVALAGATFLAVLATPLPASEALAKKEQVACTDCHDKPGSRRLTDKGKYFEVTRTFRGYDRLIADFGKCTACHVKQPGSQKLTEQGRRLAEAVSGMQELRAWIELQHPRPTPPPPR
jgi:hypothetical protein